MKNGNQSLDSEKTRVKETQYEVSSTHRSIRSSIKMIDVGNKHVGCSSHNETREREITKEVVDGCKKIIILEGVATSKMGTKLSSSLGMQGG